MDKKLTIVPRCLGKLSRKHLISVGLPAVLIFGGFDDQMILFSRIA